MAKSRLEKSMTQPDLIQTILKDSNYVLKIEYARKDKHLRLPKNTDPIR